MFPFGKNKQTYKRRLANRELMFKGEFNHKKRKKCRGHEVRKNSKRKKLDKAAFLNALEMASKPVYTPRKLER